MSFNKSLCVALGVLAATSVMAYEQSFETGADGNPLDLAGWGGYGTYSNTTAEARTLVAGVPLTNATHGIHLAVDGWVTNTLEGAESNDAQLDMLVKVARPDEELSGMSDDEAKFAMAIDTNGLLKCWVNNAWVALSTNAFTEGQWIRVAVIYDRSGQRCKVSVDGNACVTSAGYKAATGDDTNGPWYPVIRTTDAISSLKVVGTTALDDIKVAYGSNSTYTPEYNDPTTGNPITKDMTAASGSDVAIPLAWIDKNNIDVAVADAPDGSGMKVADKYITGLNPNDGSKFEMSSMTMTDDSGTIKATVTVPNTTPAPGYAIKVQTKIGDGAWGATVEDAAVVSGTAEVTLPSGSSNVSYFRMVAVPAE